MIDKFEPKSKVKVIQGKEYLEVKWRIVWFRDQHPKGGIVTSVEQTDPVLVKASVIDEEGRVLGTGYGSPKVQGVSKSRPFEGAETAAIGRALAHAGYGTQFTGEEEGEDLADAPVERKQATKPAKVTALELPVTKKAEQTKPSFNGLIDPQWLIDNQYSDSIPAAAKVINYLGIAGKAVEIGKPKLDVYRLWRNSGLEPKEAAEKTLAGEVPQE